VHGAASVRQWRRNVGGGGGGAKEGGGQGERQQHRSRSSVLEPLLPVPPSPLQPRQPLCPRVAPLPHERPAVHPYMFAPYFPSTLAESLTRTTSTASSLVPASRE